MTFVWIDRDGQRHELTDPQPIVAEGEAIACEIDRFIALLDSRDRSIRDIVRQQIAPHQTRLDQLYADLDRWNVHAGLATREAALDMIEKIKSLPDVIGRVLLVVDLHDEYRMLLKETAGLPAEQEARLAEPMTERQAAAIAACTVATPPPPTMTRGEAKAWLDGQPQFLRQEHGDDGWFAWADREEHAHRLIDPLPIEIEMAEISRELIGLRPRLVGEADPVTLYSIVVEASASWGRLLILKGDLERFDREADARDLSECRRYVADWRSKRSRP